MNTGERRAASMLQTAFRKEAVCFGAGKAARPVHGGGTTVPGEPICCFLDSPPPGHPSRPRPALLGTWGEVLGVGVLRAPGATQTGVQRPPAGDFRKWSVRWSCDVRSGRTGAAMEGKEMVIRREAETPGAPGRCVSLAWPGAPSPRPRGYAASLPITMPLPLPQSLILTHCCLPAARTWPALPWNPGPRTQRRQLGC